MTHLICVILIHQAAQQVINLKQINRLLMKVHTVNNPKTIFRVHAVQRMFERRVSIKRVLEAIKRGESIEDYSSETPEPSRLILGFQGKRPFHVVISENLETNETTVITVYVPDADRWKKDSRSRR